MKKNKSLYFLIALVSFAPLVSFAALDGIKGFLTTFKNLLGSVVPIVTGLAVLYFFWGVAQFILHDAGNDKTREEGKKKILWGVIALFVIFSIFGIINLMRQITGIDSSSTLNTSTLIK